MRSFWLEKILKHRLVAVVGGASLVLIAGGWLWGYFALRHVRQPLILHFNNLVGIDYIGSASDLAVLGVFGLLSVLVNTFLALELEEKDWFWGKLLVAATAGFAVLLFIALAAIISVNY